VITISINPVGTGKGAMRISFILTELAFKKSAVEYFSFIKLPAIIFFLQKS
jgi:hypothetical protein